jgi:hypothetical protein
MDRRNKLKPIFLSSRVRQQIAKFSAKKIKCTDAESMKGVSTRFLTMDALEAGSLAFQASRQTRQGREARK